MRIKTKKNWINFIQNVRAKNKEKKIAEIKVKASSSRIIEGSVSLTEKNIILNELLQQTIRNTENQIEKEMHKYIGNYIKR